VEPIGPHQRTRTKAFFLQQLLLYRAMGSAMFDVRVLTKSHWGGFPTHQLLYLVGMVDLRNRAAELCRSNSSRTTWATSRRCCRIAWPRATSVSSPRTDRWPEARRHLLFARVHHRDSAARLIGRTDAPYSIKTIKYKWHNDENFIGSTYNER
jgi:hypothetical protein